MLYSKVDTFISLYPSHFVRALTASLDLHLLSGILHPLLRMNSLLNSHLPLMPGLNHLPVELLIRIIDYVAVPSETPEERQLSLEAESGTQGTIYLKGLSYANIPLATSPTPDIQSLQSLRLVSNLHNHLITPLLFSVVRVLPTEASA